MVKISWLQVPNTDVTSYRLYRSIIGFMGTLADLVNVDGKTLQLKIDGGGLQTITFDGTTPIVEKINETLQDGTAYLSALDVTKFLVRSETRDGSEGSVEIVGGTALTDLNTNARVITEKSEELLIASPVATPDDTTIAVEFEDTDGFGEDWYRISSIDSLARESDKTPYFQAVIFDAPLCIIEGVIRDIEGNVVPDILVTAKLKLEEEEDGPALTVIKPIEERSGPDGIFRITVLQGLLLAIEAKELNFIAYVRVPTDRTFVFLNDLVKDDEYRLKLNSGL